MFKPFFNHSIFAIAKDTAFLSKKMTSKRNLPIIGGDT